MQAHDNYLSAYLQSRNPKIIGKGRELSAKHKDGHEIPIHLAVSEYLVDDEVHFTGDIRDLSDLTSAHHKIHEQGDRLAHASRLSLMGEMVEIHRRNVMQKMSARTLADLVRMRVALASA